MEEGDCNVFFEGSDNIPLCYSLENEDIIELKLFQTKIYKVLKIPKQFRADDGTTPEGLINTKYLLDSNTNQFLHLQVQ